LNWYIFVLNFSLVNIFLILFIKLILTNFKTYYLLNKYLFKVRYLNNCEKNYPPLIYFWICPWLLLCLDLNINKILVNSFLYLMIVSKVVFI